MLGLVWPWAIRTLSQYPVVLDDSSELSIQKCLSPILNGCKWSCNTPTQCLIYVKLTQPQKEHLETTILLWSGLSGFGLTNCWILDIKAEPWAFCHLRWGGAVLRGVLIMCAVPHTWVSKTAHPWISEKSAASQVLSLGHKCMEGFLSPAWFHTNEKALGIIRTRIPRG